MEAFDLLLKGPMHELEPPKELLGVILLLDAMDESNSVDGKPFPELLAELLRELPLWVRVAATSRPEIEQLGNFVHCDHVRI